MSRDRTRATAELDAFSSAIEPTSRAAAAEPPVVDEQALERVAHARADRLAVDDQLDREPWSQPASAKTDGRPLGSAGSRGPARSR